MATPSSTIDEININDSIIPGVTRMQDVDGFVGTIVYLGPVVSAKDPNENYAGVVWDDPSRGKHDGSVVCRRTNQLVRHFSCAHPCGASFVRLSKLNLGVVLTPAVMREKYVTAEDQLVAPNNLLPHTARTSGGREKAIEFYGELQIRSRQQLEDLDKISLRRMGIARFPLHTTVSSLQEFHHLTEMDLAGNLLSDWDTVLRIMKEVPNLTAFSVAANRIGDPSLEMMARVEDDCQEAPFVSLQLLNLNQCRITSIQSLLWIGKLLPKLQNLVFAHADLSKLEHDFALQVAGHFPNLQHLDVTSCNLTSWNDQIVPLCSALPCLEDLTLDENAINTTNPREDSTTTSTLPPSVYFLQLKSLQLSGSQIEKWQGLDGLSLFSQLEALRFRRCPLLSSLGTGEARAVTIARIANLTKLNASNITPKERIEVERRYVSTVACQLLQLPQEIVPGQSSVEGSIVETPAASPAREEFLKGHKAFAPLMEKHRDAIASTMDSASSLGSMAGASSNVNALVVVNVMIQSMAASSCHQEPLVRRLPGSLPIKRLKAMCARSFGLDPDLQRLHFCTESDAFPIELDDEEHALTYYGVSDGASIFMNEIDVEEIQRQQEKLKKEQQAKLEQQEALEMQKQRHKKQLLQVQQPQQS